MSETRHTFCRQHLDIIGNRDVCGQKLDIAIRQTVPDGLQRFAREIGEDELAPSSSMSRAARNDTHTFPFKQTHDQIG